MAFIKPLWAILLLLIASCAATQEIQIDLAAEKHAEEHKEKNYYVPSTQSTPLPEPSTEAPKVEVHVDESKPEVEVEEVDRSDQHHDPEHQSHASDSSTGRQFMPLYQPMFPQPAGGFNMIRRQFGGGMELLGDIVMMGMIGLPILGLLTVGSSSIANFFGLGSSSSSKSSSKRTRRSLREKAAGAVDYAKTLWDVMEQLERAFEKYDLYQDECRLRAVCESHHKTPRMGAWGQTILDLMRKQKELQSREILPVSRFLFSNYDEAAQAGAKGEDCSQLYTGCPHHLSYYLSAKENEVENEVEVGLL